MTSPLTTLQARALARWIQTLRPDWDVDGILHFVGEIRRHGPEEAARAATRYALNANNRTPAALPKPGPHWGPSAAGTTSPRAVSGPPCGTCGQEREVCETWPRFPDDDHGFETLEQLHARKGSRPKA